MPEFDILNAGVWRYMKLTPGVLSLSRTVFPNIFRPVEPLTLPSRIAYSCRINAPDEHAVVFNQCSSTVAVHQGQ